jgi:23S rRNA (uracil1939-C5)-methyltransferase
VFAIGPLPGEEAEVRLTRTKKDWAEAVVTEWVDTSARRGEPFETHYLSCSPWQAVEYDYQLELKRGMLEEIYARPDLKTAGFRVGEVLASPKQFGYRNKLEFTLWEAGEKGSGRLELAFHERGSWKYLKTAAEGCVLGTDVMNAAAVAVVARVNELDLVGVADTLTVRQSHTHGHVVAVLLVKEPVERDWSRLIVPEVTGVVVARKLKHDVLETLWRWGDTNLLETLGGVNLSYPWDSFFQVNPPAFERALERIMAQVKPGAHVMDLYGGAGTIGLPVARVAARVVGVEIVESSVNLANLNAAANRIDNYRAIAVAGEKMDPTLLVGADTVILDPPRAGLHPNVISMLLEAKPARIIYLSCNPVTQARDVTALLGSYKPHGVVAGFDFYPGTLHLESLVTLVRK